MRLPRLKPFGQEMVYHVYNRVAGYPGEYPFGKVEKQHLLRLVARLSQLYTVEVLAFTVMGNHYHLMLWAPAEPPSDAVTCARYTTYYGGKRPLTPGTPTCRRVAGRLADISWFLHDLQHQFASWFNRTRPVRRRGALWAGRFKHTLLEAGLAVWDCWKYIELNPVRAGLVADPADYRFGSFGQWCGTGRHPCAEALTRRLLPRFQGLLGIQTPRELQEKLRQDFAQLQAEQQPIAAVEHRERTGQPLPFRTLAHRRMRYWTDGLVIGSQAFVLAIMTTARGSAALRRHRLSAQVDAVAEASRLYAYRRLRRLES